MNDVSSSAIQALVVGAGPVGLAMAGDLAALGIRCRIIDKADKPSTLSKAVVIMPRMLEEFELRGIEQPMLDAGQRMDTFAMFADGKLVARTEYARLNSRYNYLLCLPQTDTERVLRERVIRSGLEIEWKTNLESFHQDETGVHVNLSGPKGTESFTVPYLCGCDGAHSTVRHGLDVEFEGGAYHDAWMLGDVVLDWTFPQDEACSFLHEEGYMAVFPMPEGRSRIFCVRADDSLLPEEVTIEILEEICSRWSGLTMRLKDAHWLAKFHVHHRKTTRYRVGRCFLMGDAAHLHSPETGLGMNTGIQDAFNLAWKLAMVCRGQAREDLLETFHTERNNVGKAVVEMSHGIHVLSAQFSPLMEQVRNSTFRLFNDYFHLCFSKIQQQVQLMIQYDESSIVGEHHGHYHLLHAHVAPKAGTRAIDAPIWDPRPGTWRRLYELIAGLRGKMLVFSGMAPAEAALQSVRDCVALSRKFEDLLDPVVILGSDSVQALPELQEIVYLDPSLRLHELYDSEKPRAYLVRPDGYIGLRTASIIPDEIEAYLLRFVLEDRSKAQPI